MSFFTHRGFWLAKHVLFSPSRPDPRRGERERVRARVPRDGGRRRLQGPAQQQDLREGRKEGGHSDQIRSILTIKIGALNRKKAAVCSQ